ncbi:hypothetical protein [Paraburkholderia nemoris]|uniref:hypothetical protein n=1 Tax=Paraburkholderia nemoris TaxID=2793076 RepID=UPI0038BDE171
MKMRKHARLRAEQSRRDAIRLYAADDDTTGLWAAKRAQQARDRELVRTGRCSQESMLFIAPEYIRQATIRRRSSEF